MSYLKGNEILFYNIPDIKEISFVKGKYVHHYFPEHIHNSYTIGIVEKGDRKLFVYSKPNSVYKGEVFLINPLEPHYCENLDCNYYNYFVINIKQTMLKQILSSFTSIKGYPVFNKVSINNPDIFKKILWLENKITHHDYAIYSLFVDIVKTLLHNGNITFNDSNNPTKNQILIQYILDYILDNYSMDISVSHLADQLHLSKFYFCRLFKKEVGISPYDYLIKIRIKKSMELLLNQYSQSETAINVGFYDQSHFLKFFKLNTGLTPGKYLQLNKIDYL